MRTRLMRTRLQEGHCMHRVDWVRNANGPGLVTRTWKRMRRAGGWTGFVVPEPESTVVGAESIGEMFPGSSGERLPGMCGRAALRDPQPY